MNKQTLIIIFCFSISILTAQEKIINSDSIYFQAKDLYQKEAYTQALNLTNKGLDIYC